MTAPVDAGHSVRERSPDITAAHSHGPWLSWLAAAAVVLVSSRVYIQGGLSVAVLTGVLLTPLWIRSIRRYRLGAVLLAVGVAAVLSGLWLADFAKVDHPHNSGQLIATTLDLIGVLCGIGVVAWARTVIADWLIAALFGLGMTASLVITGGIATDNPWKFGFGFPLMLVILAVVNRWGNRVVELVAVGALAISAVASDARYRFAALVITGILLAWQMRPRRAHARANTALTLAAIAGLAVIVYYGVSTLLVGGYLGEDAQARSIDQIDRSGSLLLGGRPELSASLALFGERPFGFGSGVGVSLHELLVAKTAMAGLNYDPNNGYVDIYLFGSGIELHSVAADLWAAFGLAGLLFAALAAWAMVLAMGRRLATRTATAFLFFLIMTSLWNLAFSPIYSSFQALIITVGLCLLRREAPPPDPTVAAGR